MHDFVEKGIRGEISIISKHYAKANHKGCKDFDPIKELKHLIYLDANNSYGWALSQLLPVKDFIFLIDVEIKSLFHDFMISIEDDSKTGYIYMTLI